jgi:hypothetical protein
VSDDQAAKELLKAEFERLKAEQAQRIGFRDNMVFVQFVAVGAITSFVVKYLTTAHAVLALLIIPWVCVVLGWTYVVNDHMISRIGRYIRRVMDPRARELASLKQIEVTEDDGTTENIPQLFGWEPFHRIDMRRVSRKKVQWLIDELTFFVPGVAAIAGFWLLLYFRHTGNECWQLICLILLSVIEFAALAYLCYAIGIYADWGRDTT